MIGITNRLKAFQERLVSNLSFLIIAAILASCTANKFLKEGESFYGGATINFHTNGNVSGKRAIKSELEELITPKPNSTILGSRPGVWIYYVTGTDANKKGLATWIRKKFGREPVLITDTKPEITANILQGNLFNAGFFESQVQSSVEKKSKKSEVIYDIELYPPFTIRRIDVPRDSIFRNPEDLMKDTFVKEKERYSLEKLSNEQSRIEMYAEDLGYYYFDNRHLLFEADTAVGGREIDLKLTYAPDTPEKAKRRYTFRNINVVNDYSVWQDESDTTMRDRVDTVRVDGYRYISKQGNFRPEILASMINIDSGSFYSRTGHNYTISHLMNLGTFKFVNIRYHEADSSNLNANIFMTPLPKKSIRLEVQGVSKSNNFVGPGIGATFTNRNFLRGAEQFQLKFNASYEVQLSRQQPEPLNAVELSAEASLSVPRMLLPVRIEYYSTKFIPHTKFRLGSTFQRRINYFQLNSFNAGSGYTWRETTTKNHEFYPMDINYVNVSQESDEFKELLEGNPYLNNSFQDQFIPGMRYSFTLNTQLQDPGGTNYSATKDRRSNFFFNGNFSLAGNLVNWITKGSGSSEDSTREVFGQPFSQFVLGDVDVRYYWQMDSKNRLVARIAIGSGYAYGNSVLLPYIKQFATGGSNSIRAFPARSVGPGTYDGLSDTEDVQFIDQRGDIKLEGNLEYRFDIYRFLKGAVFIDAGNIWLWDDDPQRPGAKFDKSTFIKELAVGTGFGLRMDFSFFILRFDLGFPLRKPWLQADERWVIREVDFSNQDWRSKNLVFNIAIGYPF
ncbi:MAG TPA: BamA/TamA family outer membrane protein [Cyclobacteriaceae bacterium]